jgi:hypothetical protein
MSAVETGWNWRQYGGRGLLLFLTAVLSACGRAPVPLQELNASYERALARSAPLAVAHEPGSEPQRVAFDRLQAYFTNMSATSVREQTAMVYAPDAYLNDTLVGIDGAARIEAYFSHTMQDTRVLNVRFIDRAQAGIDYFVRWEMTVEHGSLAGGKPVLSYGVTQFRFDSEGRVLLHKDFWDSGTGLYEQLPVLGRLVRGVRAVAEAGAE